jgi:2-C-methyl-D-erythritol 4-phosphate cytidylyltransferase
LSVSSTPATSGPPSLGVVLPAGGMGLRAGGAQPKQFLPLRGKPMFLYSLETFHRLDYVRSIVLVLPPAGLEKFSALPLDWPKLKLATAGGERWESVRNGVAALDRSLPFVLVHDAARPFVSPAVIGRCLEAAVAVGVCAIAALPATDTIKEIDGAVIRRTLDRLGLVRVQTPQVFPRAVLEAVYAGGWSGESPTDEAQMAERAGYEVRWAAGAESNRKVTGPGDLAWAEWMAGRLQTGEEPIDV